MEVFSLVYTVVLLVSLIVFAYFITTILRASYNYYSQMLDWEKMKEPFLFKLPSKVVSVLLVLCFLAMVL